MDGHGKMCCWIIACNLPNFLQKQSVSLRELSYSIVFLCSNKHEGGGSREKQFRRLHFLADENHYCDCVIKSFHIKKRGCL